MLDEGESVRPRGPGATLEDHVGVGERDTLALLALGRPMTREIERSRVEI